MTPMTGQSVSTAVATRETGPTAMIEQYRDDIATVLPTHIRPDTWVRLAVGALRRDPKLTQAANEDPASLMRSVLHAARLGLEPGTEEYYLTPRRVKNKETNRYQWSVLGIPGYQGLVDLMYRAGVAKSVVVETVHDADVFVWRPGAYDDQTPKRWEGPQTRPYHDIDWDLDDRGGLRLVYAYAIMDGGATSKVVVLNRGAINKIKESSDSADSQYSPWNKHEESMWLKSAARQLAKWVPTSPERVAATPVHVPSERPVAAALPSGAPMPAGSLDESEPPHYGPPDDEGPVDAELVEEPPAEPDGWPDVPAPGSGSSRRRAS